MKKSKSFLCTFVTIYIIDCTKVCIYRALTAHFRLTKLLMMVRIQLNILQSKLFDSFQYIIIFIQSLVFYLLLVIKISIILIDSTTLQLCWNMYHVCLEFVQKAIPCCRCIDFANFSKNCRNDSKITTFAKYRQWSLLQMQYGMWKRCWYKI